MKSGRYLVATGLAVLAAATTVWIPRNTIIERLSSPLLEAYGLEIVDVSLDAPATGDATIGYLALGHK